MKQVTMTRDMRPYQAGNSHVFPDDVADKLLADGDATLTPDSVFNAPNGESSAEPKKPGRGYLTRKARA